MSHGNTSNYAESSTDSNRDMSFEEAKPFLNHDPDSTQESDSSIGRRSQKSRQHRSKIFHPLIPAVILALATGVLLANIWLFSHLMRQRAAFDNSSQRHDTVTTEDVFSPVDPSLKYHLSKVHQYSPTDPFAGPPSPEFDKAWSNLLSPFNIKLTATEMRQSNKQSFRLASFSSSSPSSSSSSPPSNDNDDVDEEPQEDFYLGYLEVYHQLHCIKDMIQIRYPESYPHLQAQGKLSEEHFAHCVQVLKNSIMCHADTSLGTWRWNPDDNEDDVNGGRVDKLHHHDHGDESESVSGSGSDGFSNTTNSKLTIASPHVEAVPDGMRKCVNWESLDRWARGRALHGWDYELSRPGEEGFWGP